MFVPYTQIALACFVWRVQLSNKSNTFSVVINRLKVVFNLEQKGNIYIILVSIFTVGIETFAFQMWHVIVWIWGQRLTLLQLCKLTKDRVLCRFHSHQHFSRDPQEQLLCLNWTESPQNNLNCHYQKHTCKIRQLFLCTVAHKCSLFVHYFK